MISLITPKNGRARNVDLRVAEEPEQVLPEHRTAGLDIEDVHPEAPVATEPEERGRQHREDDEREQRRHEHGPGEDRHTEHRHAWCAHADDRRDEVDRPEDGAETGEGQAEDAEVGAEAGAVDRVDSSTCMNQPNDAAPWG
jgi:hypothetical protein